MDLILKSFLLDYIWQCITFLPNEGDHKRKNVSCFSLTHKWNEMYTFSLRCFTVMSVKLIKVPSKFQNGNKSNIK